MLALAAVMVFAPALMENPLAALALFVGAFGLAGIIHVVTTHVRRDRATALAAAALATAALAAANEA